MERLFMISKKGAYFGVGSQQSLSRAAKLCLVAEDILQETSGRAAHIDDITKAAVDKNMNLGLSAEEFKSKLSGALAAEVKRKRGSIFSRVTYKKAGVLVSKKGWYKLRQITSTTVIHAPPVQADNIYFGKFGEYAVISELLYWGFNASPMIVDQGIDLVAEKGSKYFYIQVKASYERESAWRFTIKKTSFQANHSGSTYYVFVLRAATEIKNTFVVVPSSHIDTLVKSNSIKGDSGAMSIKISSADKGKVWRLNNTECSMFVGAFGQLV